MLVSTRIVSAFFTGLINNEGKLEIEGTATIEFVGSLIGILGVVFMISGMFYKKEIIIQIIIFNKGF